MRPFPASSLPFVLTLLAWAGTASAQVDAPHGSSLGVEEGIDYRIYDRDGRAVQVDDLVDAVRGDEVLLLGEEHDDMVGHALQTVLFTRIVQEIGAPAGGGRPVVLSLEMFERDVQYVLDEYLADLITEDHFLRSSRPWDDYAERYRPIVEHAKAFGTPVVAANAPRRYVNRVTNHGPDSLGRLSSTARTYLPPLPFPGPSAAYRAQWDAIMTEAMLGAGRDPEAPRRELNPNAIYAQALWDASMGHAITQALVEHIGGLVIHLAGSFHVAEYTGIPERISDYRPGTRVTTVVMTRVEDISAWSAQEHAALADYVVLTLQPEEPTSGGLPSGADSPEGQGQSERR